MRFSVIVSSVVAIIVGFGGSFAIILAAADALGADESAKASWLVVLCLSMMATSAILSFKQKIPIVTAWSTPGAALIATTSGISLEQACGAFLMCGALTLLTGSFNFLEELVKKIPTTVATGILAGVLFPFVQAVANSFESNSLLAFGMIGTFLILRPISSAWAVIGVLFCGLFISILTTVSVDTLQFELARPQLVAIEWDWTTVIGLGIPLYIVTMASQNLPGVAVIKTAGYSPGTRSIFTTTGIATILNSFFGAHSIGLAAITASICLSDETHPNRSKRWLSGITYAVGYGMLAFLSPTLVAFFVSLPSEFIINLAGLALIGPLIMALSVSFKDESDRLPGTVAFIVTASGVSYAGVGAAFWALIASLIVIASTIAIEAIISPDSNRR